MFWLMLVLVSPVDHSESLFKVASYNSMVECVADKAHIKSDDYVIPFCTTEYNVVKR